ncbi:MAG: hypothetical protein R6W96_07560 [Clostridia bacterium]
MATTGKKDHWRIVFNIAMVVYVVNLLSIIFRGTCILFDTKPVYNYLSAVLTGIFLFVFFQFLKKGALTVRYLCIMFVGLVVIPLVLFIVLGGVGFR